MLNESIDKSTQSASQSYNWDPKATSSGVKVAKQQNSGWEKACDKQCKGTWGIQH